jgi:hypothetical protein
VSLDVVCCYPYLLGTDEDEWSEEIGLEEVADEEAALDACKKKMPSST